MPTVLLILVVLAYIPGLMADFAYWDDDDLIFYNNNQLNFGLNSLRWMFTTSFSGHFQPLTWITYAVDFQLWHSEAFGYHLTSILFHLATTLTFYFVVKRLLAACTELDQQKSLVYILSAAFGAFVFAVHPLRAESVIWVAERRDVISGFFYMLTMVFYLRYTSVQNRGAYLVAIACCTMSLLAKASAVMLPLVLLVLDVYPLRRIKLSVGLFHKSSRRVWMEKIPFFVLALAGGIRALMAQKQAGALYPLSEYDIPSRFAQACHGFVFYLWKTIWPANLGPLYELRSRTELFSSMLWVSLLIMVAIVGFTIYRRHRWPALAVAMAVYAIQISPVLGFFQSGPQRVADRYSYLSCMGFAVLAGVILLRVIMNPILTCSRQRRSIILILAVVVIASLFRSTEQQGEYWQTPISLWKRGIQVSPDSSIANVNYADALAGVGELKLAIKHYEIGLQIEPRDAIALSHLGKTLVVLGRDEEAVRAYLSALLLDPNRSNDYLELAQLYINQHRPEKAVTLLRRRIQQTRKDLDVISFLAELLATHPDASIRNGEEAVRFALFVSYARGETDSSSQMTLSTALAEAGRFEEAVEIAEKAIFLAKKENKSIVTRELLRRIEMFRNSKPYHYGD